MREGSKTINWRENFGQQSLGLGERSRTVLYFFPLERKSVKGFCAALIPVLLSIETEWRELSSKFAFLQDTKCTDFIYCTDEWLKFVCFRKIKHDEVDLNTGGRDGSRSWVQKRIEAWLEAKLFAYIRAFMSVIKYYNAILQCNRVLRCPQHDFNCDRFQKI